MDGANKRPREAIEPAPGVAAVARVVSAAAVPAFDASAAKVLATGQVPPAGGTEKLLETVEDVLAALPKTPGLGPSAVPAAQVVAAPAAPAPGPCAATAATAGGAPWPLAHGKSKPRPTYSMEPPTLDLLSASPKVLESPALMPRARRPCARRLMFASSSANVRLPLGEMIAASSGCCSAQCASTAPRAVSQSRFMGDDGRP